MVNYCWTTVPTYPSGQIGFIVAATNPSAGEPARCLSNPIRTPSAEMQNDLKYYNAAMHKAAFSLPQFVEKVVAKVRKDGQ